MGFKAVPWTRTDPYSTAVCGQISETTGTDTTLCVSAPNGGGISTTFTSVVFASYGTPNGSCGAYTYSGCHSSSSMGIIQSVALGRTSFCVRADNGTFGDPCRLTYKRLYVQLIASGTITTSGIDYVFVPVPVIDYFYSSPNPQTSGVDGVPNYDTQQYWGSTNGLTATITNLSTGFVAGVSPSGNRNLTNLPQSTAGSTSPATRSFTLTVCNELNECVSRTITVQVYNDNTSNNFSLPNQNNVEPNTFVTVSTSISGIDMATSVNGGPGVQVSTNNSSFSSNTIITNNQTLYARVTSLGFNQSPNGLTNSKQFYVDVGPLRRYFTVTTRAPVPTVTFSLDSSSICRGSSATLTWSANFVNSVSINQGIGSVTASGTRSVSPTSTTTYTITATGLGGTVTRIVTLTVYQPTTTNLSLDALTIIRGQSTTLRWVTTGDATSATIDQGIGAVNINGNRSISPSETSRYTVYVTGICTNSSDFVTLTVYQPPTVEIIGPDNLDYGQQGTLSYEATDADISLIVTPSYAYKGFSVTGTVINLPIGASEDGQITTQIPYNDFGPFNVTYVIVATGNGGQETKQITIPINVDETPDNFLVPESEDLLKDQAPIYTPDAIVTSYEIVISDIDIPVEVKSDKPILIDVNSQEDWKPIREL
jgi:hypothetical protein